MPTAEELRAELADQEAAEAAQAAEDADPANKPTDERLAALEADVADLKRRANGGAPE